MFLEKLFAIDNVIGPTPGQHSWWRGDHISVCDNGAKEQIAKLSVIIDKNIAVKLWEHACKTKSNQNIYIDLW